ncbi:Protein of unknown function [Lactobacillus acidophilus DSM 20079 = JCM 1132 = NBRC 13951 = CIP 76.13]|uniref:Uncharacterized protein n=2 Tax=Lactobacillus helveticus TaxID=1587 RepID=U4QJA5_LACHE|nr:Protein of unknown function [Lactobacillus acidophilus DSM 20079 = JCM 1132 = NBRC 13951 = CIP 76.13]CDF70387.1 Protein of unknown function [Lactobacillus acidophilus CIRM-BIA 442]CDF72181.1 Protein of unknown function [Lactobacillus acidophilus CIRM-BIA 445]CDF76009.1 Protein of unknown function [Lactobacillus acidophilus DSM 20242]CDI43651.1 Protein of unknown function [Lactobacillus helveticus CIRM-BIA 953]CDI60568.1 Protein of unknown function [Lactobacillus helveticus CIRM-BIA 104]CDI
MKNKKVEL